MIDRISVVMPTYNAMPYLQESVESILAQTFTNFEFLIVNDGSTDGTRAYLDSLTDPRIRIIHQRNRGIVATLNTGINEANADWIARMDADDVADPRRFEKEVEFLNQNPKYSLVSCAFGYIGVTGHRLKAIHIQILNSPPIYHPIVDPVICHQGTLYKRDAVVAVGGYREVQAAEDLDLWLRLDEASYNLASIPNVLMFIRVLPNGISSKSFVVQRVSWKYAFSCSLARREGRTEPNREEFYKDNWPKGWRRLRDEGARQFRLAGASWADRQYFSSAARLFLSFLLRPDYALSKFRLYFFGNTKRKRPAKVNL
jgi:glycosyltransferase involved in cell wall biosynthesis